jgi:hypothetical protein
MNYEEWEAKAPSVITSDSVWKMRAYRLALFVSDIGWQDVTRLGTDDRTTKLAGQLYHSLGSIGANLAKVSFHRMSLLEEIIRLISTMIPDQRGRTLRDNDGVTSYEIENLGESSELLVALLHNIPLVQS